MDGPHDLGGRQGFGPVAVDEPEVAFHHEWEGRMWGLSRSSGVSDWTIDWWRHVRELIAPADYLERPYFDSWAQTDLAAYIDSGVITLDEVVSGKSATPSQDVPRVIDKAGAIALNASDATRYDRDIATPPAFDVGDAVRTRARSVPGHTRLPAYVRGHRGLVHAHHGAHLIPDEGAKGREVAGHLYSVVFEAGDLWKDAGGRRDRVFLDLWECYLDPA